jgi:hypothetical protein
MFERRLMTVVHEGGVAAVVRDWCRRVWLGDPYPGTLLEGFEPGSQGLGPEVTLAGGLLPPGAVAAVVHDRAGRAHEATCSNRAWLALVPEPVRGERPLVRSLDMTGQLVAVPLPAGVTLEGVSDAVESWPVCPASDGREWWPPRPAAAAKMASGARLPWSAASVATRKRSACCSGDSALKRPVRPT